MNRRPRTSPVVPAALSAGLLTTACEGGSTDAAVSPDVAVVDEPVTTDWHTDPADAVPFTS